MGGRTGKKKKKGWKSKENGTKVRMKSRGILNTGLSSINREASTAPIYLPLKSRLFCHHLVKLLYLGEKKHPHSNLGVPGMRTPQHPAQNALPRSPFSPETPLTPRSISCGPGGQLCLRCSPTESLRPPGSFEDTFWSSPSKSCRKLA